MLAGAKSVLFPTGTLSRVALNFRGLVTAAAGYWRTFVFVRAATFSGVSRARHVTAMLVMVHRRQ